MDSQESWWQKEEDGDLIEEWEKRYEGVKTPDLAGKKILFAYNLCLDRIKHVEETSWIIPHAHTPAHIETMEDIFSGLLACMRSGVGNELIFSDRTLKERIESLGFGETHLGGQAGIMASYACLLGAQSILYPHYISEEIKGLLDARILSFQEKRLMSVREMRAEEGVTHYVFEFARGTEAFGFKVPRAGRFIVSHVYPNLEFNDDFEQMLPGIAEEIDSSVISGFHLIAENYINATQKEHIARIMSHMEILRKNKNNKIHCEMAAMRRKVASRMEDIFPLTDSVGLNESELSFLAGVFGKRVGKDIVSLYEGMLFLAEKSSLKRIHLHNLGYYLCLTDDPQKEREALLFSSLATACRARNGGIKGVSEIMRSKDVPVSKKGIEEIKVLAKHLGSDEIALEGIHDNLVCIPTKVAYHPTSTVGLGDTISSAFFL